MRLPAQVKIYFIGLLSLFVLSGILIGVRQFFLIPAASKTQTETAGEETLPTVNRKTDESEPEQPESTAASDPGEGEGESETEPEETTPVETTAYEMHEFTEVGLDYFEDALFIGDSRMVGIREYSNLPGTFFANEGFTVFDVTTKKTDVPGYWEMDLAEVLQTKEYGKIFLMLGINDADDPMDQFEEQYIKVVEKLRAWQPNAVIYLCANLHVTREKSAGDDVFNNAKLDQINEIIKAAAIERHCYYINANAIFDDENGDLRSDFSGDGVHIYAKYYAAWVDWLCTKGVVD